MNKSILGLKSINNKDTPMQIVAHRKNKDIDVEFLDEHHYIKEHTTVSNFNRGQIKNPFDRSVFGIGYLGAGEHKTRNGDQMTNAYITWKHLLCRCYVEHYKNMFNAYYGKCTICDEWLNFQNFAEWYEANEYKCEGRIHLDKDILISGNKHYSPETCLLVPQRINMLFLNKPNNRCLPNGIIKHNNKYYAKYNEKELGCYDDIYEAYSIYSLEKKSRIVEIANEYKNVIPSKVYEALLNYEVKMENDINIK